MKVAIYARVSTQHQVQEQGIEAQLERLVSGAKEQAWTISPEHIFRDDGCSGATLNRPGLAALRASISADSLDRILITAPDRLARQYVHQVLLLEELERFGAEVVFLERPMSQDPHDQLLLQIRGAVAQYERNLISERMRQGRERKLKAGVLLPWSRAPYGYQVDQEHPRDPQGVRIDDVKGAVVREIYARYLEAECSLFSLACSLTEQQILSPMGKHHWSFTTLRAILCNPAYLGQVYAGRGSNQPPRVRQSALRPVGHSSTYQAMPKEAWILVTTIPAIIDQDTFDQVQAKLAKNRSFARRNNTVNDYLLRALLSCGVCSLACSGRADRSGYAYYLCRGKEHIVHSHRDERCPARYTPVQQLDTLVWQDLCELVTHPEQLAWALERALGGGWLPQELQARRTQLRRGKAALEAQLERLTEAYLAGVMLLPEYQRRRGELEMRQKSLNEQEQALSSEVDRRLQLTTLGNSAQAFCERIRGGLEQATFKQKRTLVELLIDRVIVTGENVEIRYVIPLTGQSEQIRFCHLRTDYRSHA